MRTRCFAILALAWLLLACEPKPASETAPGTRAAEDRRAGTCAGAIKDDGSVETGYGFVPSATFGEYVQEFLADELPSRRMQKVCICWLKTRHERDVDFEIVFYTADGDLPADEPYAAVPATAAALPQSVATAGKFYEVDVVAVTLKPGVSYIGARWDPSAARFLFVCADHSEETAPTRVFFREDRGPRWVSAQDSRDPVFTGHRAILLRAEAARP